MKIKAILAASAAALVLTGCASTGRLMSYGSRMADAQVHVGRAGYNIWYHPSDMTIIVQERFGGGMGGAFLEGATFGAVETSPPIVVPRHAGAAYLARFGCRVTDAYTLEDVTTEIRYECDGSGRPGRIDERPLCADGDPYSSDWQEPDAITLTRCPGR